MGDFLYDMQHARVIQWMQVIKIIRAFQRPRGCGTIDHPPTTATSIEPKWRRDSAKRDAKQLLFSAVGFSTYRNGRDTHRRHYESELRKRKRSKRESIKRKREVEENERETTAFHRTSDEPSLRALCEEHTTTRVAPGIRAVNWLNGYNYTINR